MTVWRDDLDRLKARWADSDDEARQRSRWRALVDDARSFEAAAVMAGGTIATLLADAALTVDQLDLYVGDVPEVREALAAAAKHGYQWTDEELADAIERWAGFDLRQMLAIANKIQGGALELRVGELFDAGLLPNVPEGASGIEWGHASQPGVEGWFTDVSGTPLGGFQVKATASSGPIAQHFAAHPDVDLVYVNSDVAAVAVARGLDVQDVGVSLDDLGLVARDEIVDVLDVSAGEVVGDLLDDMPSAALAMVAWSAWRRHQRGEEPADIRDASIARLRDIGLWHGAGIIVEAATGSSAIRAVGIGAGRLGTHVSSDWSSRVVRSTARVAATRRMVPALS